MVGLIVVYAALVVLGMQHVKGELLSYTNWRYAPMMLPVLVVVFGYQNLLPTMTIYLQGDRRRLVRAILFGGIGAFCICILWEWIILGIVPVEGPGGLKQAYTEGQLATQALYTATGAGWITDVGQMFAFFAIVTSFLGVALSFVDFLADGLKVPKSPKGMLLLCFLVLTPAYICAISSPTIFVTALDYAGGFGAVIIFGILPVLMVWKGRYRNKMSGQQILPGGRALLLVVAVFAAGIFLLELAQEMHWLGPPPNEEVWP